MKLFRLREKLGDHGLVLLEHGTGWVVTNNGTAKTYFEEKFKNLEEVEVWFNSRLLKSNRLTDKEAEEFDEYFKRFVEE